MRWALVVRKKGTRRPETAVRLATALGARGLRVAGITQVAFETDGEPAGYRLRRLGTTEEVTLARRGAAPRHAGERTFCSFVFDDRAFLAARAWLAHDAAGADLVVVDEVGRLEAADGGHAAAVRAALAGPALPLLVVRDDSLFGVVERFGLGEPVAMLDAMLAGTDATAEAAFVDALAMALAPVGGGA